MSRTRSPVVTALLVAAAVVIIQGLLLPLFAAPAANAEPRDLPVVVAGPGAAADGFAAQLDAARPGAFEITQVADATAADQALRDREAYAAFVLGPDGPSLRLASAASPTVAALLTQAAAELGRGAPVPVVDVVPAHPDDPRGAGFAAGFLPLVLTSMIAGILLVLLVPNWRGRLTGVLAYAVFAGLAAASGLRWLGVLGGDYLATAAAIGLIALAASAVVAGLGSLLGSPGTGLGALLVFLVGNPLSAVSAAPELLPQPWGQLGQWLPAGAGGTLLRSVAWFDGAGSAAALWTLVVWAAAGLLFVTIGRKRLLAGDEQPSGPGVPADGRALAGAS